MTAMPFGLIGFGRIGNAMAKRARAFDLRLNVVNQQPNH
jgi:phosphoglycerate dehydrogenase-like enzyme